MIAQAAMSTAYRPSYRGHCRIPQGRKRNNVRFSVTYVSGPRSTFRIKDDRLIDPSAGSGNFLTEVLSVSPSPGE